MVEISCILGTNAVLALFEFIYGRLQRALGRSYLDLSMLHICEVLRDMELLGKSKEELQEVISARYVERRTD